MFRDHNSLHTKHHAQRNPIGTKPLDGHRSHADPAITVRYFSGTHKAIHTGVLKSFNSIKIPFLLRTRKWCYQEAQRSCFRITQFPEKISLLFLRIVLSWALLQGGRNCGWGDMPGRGILQPQGWLHTCAQGRGSQGRREASASPCATGQLYESHVCHIGLGGREDPFPKRPPFPLF